MIIKLAITLRQQKIFDFIKRHDTLTGSHAKIYNNLIEAKDLATKQFEAGKLKRFFLSNRGSNKEKLIKGFFPKVNK